MGGKLAWWPKEEVLYLNGNGVKDKIVSWLRNGCLVIAFGCWLWKDMVFFYVVHLDDHCSLALWVLVAVTHEEKSIHCKKVFFVDGRAFFVMLLLVGFTFS